MIYVVATNLGFTLDAVSFIQGLGFHLRKVKFLIQIFTKETETIAFFAGEKARKQEVYLAPRKVAMENKVIFIVLCELQHSFKNSIVRSIKLEAIHIFDKV